MILRQTIIRGENMSGRKRRKKKEKKNMKKHNFYDDVKRDEQGIEEKIERE